jgi:uncharacterized phage protein (TIGR02218 family)
MAFHEGLAAHLATGLTTTAHAWRITRRDGVILGFTDHDRDLNFDDTLFRAGSGLSAVALQQASGLSVDNTEAVGALSDAAIRGTDIDAGRYDAAQVEAWLVNWADLAQRQLLFRGHLGDITREGEAFRAELRGQTEALNRPIGRVFQKPCTAVLGDASCAVDLSDSAYVLEVPLVALEGRVGLSLTESSFAEGWFQRGLCTVLSGEAAGLSRMVKRDQIIGGLRRIDLWEELRAPLAVGDLVRLTAGCDKRFETCRLKFSNVLNFQGFPDLPSSDWLAIVPGKTSLRDGGSQR